MLSGKLEKQINVVIAKIAGIKLSEALYEDHNLDIVCLMPTNIYGINDNLKIFRSRYSCNDKQNLRGKNKNKKSIKLLVQVSL